MNDFSKTIRLTAVGAARARVPPHRHARQHQPAQLAQRPIVIAGNVDQLAAAARQFARVVPIISHHHGKAAGFSAGGFNVPYPHIPNGAADSLAV